MQDMTPIEISVSEAERQLQAVGLPFLPGGLEKYCAVFSSGGTELIRDLSAAPFPKRVQVRNHLRKLDNPLSDFLRFYGLQVSPISEDVTKIESSEWDQIFAGFSDYPLHRVPSELKPQIDNIAKKARSLYKAVQATQIYLNTEAGVLDGEGPHARRAAVCRFLTKLLHVAPEVFAKKLTTRNEADATGREASGPGITYMRTSLSLLRHKALGSGFLFVRDEKCLVVPPSTLSDWFYKKRTK